MGIIAYPENVSAPFPHHAEHSAQNLYLRIRKEDPFKCCLDVEVKLIPSM